MKYIQHLIQFRLNKVYVCYYEDDISYYESSPFNSTETIIFNIYKNQSLISDSQNTVNFLDIKPRTFGFQNLNKNAELIKKMQNVW